MVLSQQTTGKLFSNSFRINCQKLKNIQTKSKASILIKVQCVTNQWIRLKGTDYHISYPVFAYFRLFRFYTQEEAVGIDYCVKISYKSDNK